VGFEYILGILIDKMRLKILLITLLVSSLFMNLFFYLKSNRLEERILNKDKAITEMRHLINQLSTKSHTISFISNALKNDFNVDGPFQYNASESSYLVVTPKDWNNIDYQNISDFYGLEVSFDANDTLSGITFHKP